MRYAPLGDSGFDVSVIGFGTWGLGSWAPGQLSYGVTDDDISLAALERALSEGITFYDTAGLYGLGHAERLLGQAFRRCRDKVVIGTKLGYVGFDGTKNYDPAYLDRALDDSLARLQTGYVDLLQLHDPAMADLTGHPAMLKTLDGFVGDGRVRALGVSPKTPQEAVQMIGEFPFKAAEINFNMMDLRALDCGLFEAAVQQGVGLIARTPLCFGFLTGAVNADTDFKATDHRSRWPRAQIARWARGARKLHAVIHADLDNIAENTATALRFCLSWPAISTVIPGMMHPADVSANARTAHLATLSQDQLSGLQETYARLNLFQRPQTR